VPRKAYVESAFQELNPFRNESLSKLAAAFTVPAMARFGARECGRSGVTQDSGDDGWQRL
jgi:hypothetical protein